MKIFSILLLVALILLPARLAAAQGSVPAATPSPSPSPDATPTTTPVSPELSKLITKTGKSSPAKVINRPPPPAEYDPKNIQFLPPSKSYVPSTKTSVMTYVQCSEGKSLWVTTEGLTPFSMSLLKFTEGGQILVLQPDGNYLPYAATEQPNTARPQDVQLAQTIVKVLKPKKLTIMPKYISFEKDAMAINDPFTLMEILRDHIGRDAYDVNVAKPANCYKIPAPIVLPSPTPVVQQPQGTS